MKIKTMYSWKRVTEDGLLKDLPEKWEGQFNDSFDTPEEAILGMEEYLKRRGPYASSGDCVLVCRYWIETE